MLENVSTMKQRTSDATVRRRFQVVTLTAFAAIAVLLALIGLSGLLAHGVRHRTVEIGVRMTLGATQRHIVRMVLQDGLIVTGAGLLVGLLGAAGLGRYLAASLYGVRVLDAVTFVLVPVLMLSVAAIACSVPAWRASRIDPANCLRRQ